MKIEHVIIDGSNIATEGRDAPSLAQLDEAVQAFIEEYSPDYVTVVVDATFPNRIDAKERKTYEDAVNANELVTPPAGAIGRGDAFVLQIAKRAGASILSNDSFQEFHGEYPWLFEKGRLIGGKPVPHVGWVFMERAPVRGPTSRRAMSEARKEARSMNTQPTWGTGLPPMRRPFSKSHGYWPWNSWKESLERIEACARRAICRTNPSPRPMAPAGGVISSLAATASSYALRSPAAMRLGNVASTTTVTI